MKTSTSLAILASLGGASAFWRMECRGRAGLARLDPLMNPGGPAQHAHAIHGSSGKPHRFARKHRLGLRYLRYSPFERLFRVTKRLMWITHPQASVPARRTRTSVTESALPALFQRTCPPTGLPVLTSGTPMAPTKRLTRSAACLREYLHSFVLEFEWNTNTHQLLLPEPRYEEP